MTVSGTSRLITTRHRLPLRIKPPKAEGPIRYSGTERSDERTENGWTLSSSLPCVVIVKLDAVCSIAHVNLVEFGALELGRCNILRSNPSMRRRWTRVPTGPQPTCRKRPEYRSCPSLSLAIIERLLRDCPHRRPSSSSQRTCCPFTANRWRRTPRVLVKDGAMDL